MGKTRNWKVVAIDQTGDWREDIQDMADGPILSVYLVDMGLAVHCCSMTPSYECTFLYYSASSKDQDDDARDEFDQLIHSAEEPTVSYYNDRRAFVQIVDTGLPVIGEPGTDENEQSLEDAREYCCANYLI